MKLSQFAAASALAALVVAVPATAAHLQNGRPLMATLDGASEVPGPGDEDGDGSLVARVNVGQGQFCYTLMVSGIDPATAAHIHEAPAGSAGGVVISLSAPSTGTSSGCVTISKDLAREIVASPSDYYVNVHNPAFPGGAVRGQLEK
jgi:hypothetical protein